MALRPVLLPGFYHRPDTCCVAACAPVFLPGCQRGQSPKWLHSGFFFGQASKASAGA